MSRKGTEMSINVLVGIILGMIMLAAAIFIFFKIMNNTCETSCEVDQQTQSKITAALDSGEPIYVPESEISPKTSCCGGNKDGVVFYIGIRNTFDNETDFKVDIKPSPSSDFDVSKIAYFGDFSIPAKGVYYATVVVDTKGLTEQVSLLVNVSYDPTGQFDPPQDVQYWKPKIVRIEPK
ncbi:MAG: hypothetical protein ACP5N3_02520 [Candidatus Nanoarchaeia archaeon]